ncbi:MAG: hypothetical protein Kow0090_01550 [Myxococcota bacterium]
MKKPLLLLLSLVIPLSAASDESAISFDQLYKILEQKRAELKNLTEREAKEIAALEEELETQKLGREALSATLKTPTKNKKPNEENDKETLVLAALARSLDKFLTDSQKHLIDHYPPATQEDLLEKIGRAKAELEKGKKPLSSLFQDAKTISDRIAAIDGGIIFKETFIILADGKKLRGYHIGLGAVAGYFITSDYKSGFIWNRNEKTWREDPTLVEPLEQSVKILRRQKAARLVQLPISLRGDAEK